MVKKYYLAYGSNLNLDCMKNRCNNAKKIGTTRLNDYKLVFKGCDDGYAYLSIEKSLGEYVPLGVFEITLFDEYKLDKYEGYPELYYKKLVDVIINGKNEKGLIYIMNDEYIYHLPSEEYLETCIEGYNNFGFDLCKLKDALSINNKVKKK